MMLFCCYIIMRFEVLFYKQGAQSCANNVYTYDLRLLNLKIK